MLEYLKFKYSFLGIDAPAFAWAVALLLIVYTIVSAIQLSIKLFRQLGYFKNAAEFVRSTIKPGQPGQGVDYSVYSEIDQYFLKKAPDALRSSWNEYRSHLIARPAEGENRYWSSIDADESFSERKLVSETLNRNYYQSLPGVITGIGLLTTFLAILVALLDVRLVDNRVQGLELLIQGLSGKFVSSVVALLCATAFVIFEKNRFHALERGQLRLASLLNRAIPRLSPVQILVDLQTNFVQMHKDANTGLTDLREEIKAGIESIKQSTALLQEDVSNQTTCIQDFNTGLAPMLQQTFDESMTPTLKRMVTSIEGMNELLRAAEANKNESITDSIKELLTNLQASLTGSINEMGGKFNESLSSSAQAQFSAVADSLTNTTNLLNGMNQQFLSSQTALQEMINHARSSTQDQISMNHNQLNLLTDTIGRLMVDLSDRVNELSEQMSDSVQANSEHAVGVAEKVINHAKEWTTENAAQLTRLLEVHQSQFERVVQTRELLDGTIVKFNDSLENLMNISINSQASVQQINSAVAAITVAADKTASTQQSLQKLSELVGEQVSDLEEAHRGQKEVWDTIHGNMDRYKQTFGTVERQAAELLQQISQNLENYQQTCEKGFSKLIESSDSHFTNATQRLGASVSELDEVLQDLSESFARFDGVKTNGHR